jgi:hypothetical protein
VDYPWINVLKDIEIRRSYYLLEGTREYGNLPYGRSYCTVFYWMINLLESMEFSFKLQTGCGLEGRAQGLGMDNWMVLINRLVFNTPKRV